MVMTHGWESVGCEIIYRNICFLGKENLNLISLILNTQSKKVTAYEDDSSNQLQENTKCLALKLVY